MPMLIATAGTPKDCPICGSEVEMIVESSSCMKNAMATISATRRALRGAYQSGRLRCREWQS